MVELFIKDELLKGVRFIMHKYAVGITSGILVAGLTGYILMDTFVISKEQTEEMPTTQTTAYQLKNEEKQTTVQPKQEEKQETSSDTEKKDEVSAAEKEEDFEPKTYNSEFGKNLSDQKDSETETDEEDYAYGYGSGNSQSNRNDSDSQSGNWFDNYFENYKRDYSNDDFSADWEEWFRKEFRTDDEGWSFFYEPGTNR